MGEQDNVLHHHGLWVVAVAFGLALTFESNTAQHHTTSSHLPFLIMSGCVLKAYARYFVLAVNVRLQNCFLFTALDTTGS